MTNKKILINLFALFSFSFITCFYFLSYEEPLARKSLYTVTIFGLLIYLRQISQKVFNIFVIFNFLICSLVYPVHVVYGELTYMYVSSIFLTNFSESISYLKLIPFSTYIYLCLFALFSYWLIKNDKLENLKFKYGYLLILPLLFIPVKKIALYGKSGHLEDYFNILPLKKTVMVTNWAYDINQKYKYLQLESQKPSTWKIEKESDRENREIVVLIIGESLRKDFLHSYGFPIKNTPFIDASNNIQFNNFISAASTTASSLSKSLALSTDLNSTEPYNNIISLTKKIGYSTFWLSSQEPISIHGSPISLISLNADFYKFKNNEMMTNC